MKKIIKSIFFLCICLLPVTGKAELVKIMKSSVPSGIFSIPAGEVWQLLSFSTSWWNASEAGFIYSSETPSSNNRIGIIPITRGNLVGKNNGPSSSLPGVIFAGPSTFILNPEVESYFFLFKKMSLDSTISSSSSSVIIPSSSQGDIDLKLEQSADHVTWTECLPGTYNSSTVKRFFRLRAVEK
jgi:hypothetical protein